MTLLPLILAVQSLGDGDLVLRLQRRDPRALGELYDRYGRLTYSLIFRIIRDTGIAEDLVQETFLRVWNRAQGFDVQRGSMGSWLLAVARNSAIDYLRSRRGQESRVLEFDENLHPSLYADLEREMISSDSARRIKAALEKLPDNHRQVIELAYFEGLSQTEMAARMGQPLGTIKTWVRNALRSLRDEMGAAVPA
jgi:RNA polymerase sigma-70 factor (ECF subfamily)